MLEKFKHSVGGIVEKAKNKIEKAAYAAKVFGILVASGLIIATPEMKAQGQEGLTPEKEAEIKAYVMDNVKNGIDSFGDTFTFAENNPYNTYTVYEWDKDLSIDGGNSGEIVKNKAGDLMLIRTVQNPDGSMTIAIYVDKAKNEKGENDSGDVDQFDAVTVNPNENPSAHPDEEAIDQYVKFFAGENFSPVNVEEENITIPGMSDLKPVSTKDLTPEQQEALGGTYRGFLKDYLVKKFNDIRIAREHSPEYEQRVNQEYKDLSQ